MLDGSKQVGSGGLEAVGNSNGPSMQKRLKERTLKDLTNKLEPGPKNFKPAWNGLKGGIRVVIREGVVGKNTAHGSKAHFENRATSKGSGSG